MHDCRLATPADVAAICALEKELNRAHHDAAPLAFKAPDAVSENSEYWERYLEKPDTVSLVAKLDGNVVGFITAEVIDETHPLAQPVRYARMGGVCVAPSARGRGIGRSLVQAAENWAVERGAVEFRLTVWKFNGSAIDLYESMGFATRSFTMSKCLADHVG
jgi:ribosomal protein S18 acetylase RimI-like enzyme